MIKYERVGVYRGEPNGKTNTLRNDKEMAQEREKGALFLSSGSQEIVCLCGFSWSHDPVPTLE